MKNIKKYIGIIALVIISSALFAQTPPPPNNGNGNNVSGNTPVGGGAPIGGGLMVLMATAGAYGYTKWKNNIPDYKIEE